MAGEYTNSSLLGSGYIIDSPIFPTTRNISISVDNLFLIIILKFLIRFPPMIILSLRMFPTNLIIALVNISTLITGSSYTAVIATKPDSQRTKNACVHGCKGTIFKWFHQIIQKKISLHIQIILYAVKHVRVKFYVITIIDDKVDFSFEERVIH